MLQQLTSNYLFVRTLNIQFLSSSNAAHIIAFYHMNATQQHPNDVGTNSTTKHTVASESKNV